MHYTLFFLLKKAKNISRSCAKNIGNNLLNIFFPSLCISCRRHTDINNNHLCSDCRLKISILNSTICPICRSRLPEFKSTCHRTPCSIGGATDFHHPTIKNSIHFLKFKKIKSLSKPLANFICLFAKRSGLPLSEYDLVIPIPLSLKRLNERGFNQAELIAGHCSNYWQIPLSKNLIRVKNTLPQSSLKDKNHKIINVSNCFSVQNPADLKNKNIILIDDVITTANTVNAAAQTLKSAGAGKIIALSSAIA